MFTIAPELRAVLGAIGGVVHLELLHGIDGWLEGDLVLHHGHSD